MTMRNIGNSMVFVQRLLKETGIVATAGIGFGKYGEGYVRFALTIDKERIKEAIVRLRKLMC